MKAKSKQRLLAEKLRCEQGLSYNEISEKLGVSKSTLSNWLKGLPLSAEQEERILQRVEKNRSSFAARAWQINKDRYRNAREQAFQSGADIALHLSDEAAIHEIALAMLYLGEGNKTGNRVQIASIDPMILNYFLWALNELYSIGREQVSLRLNLNEIARPLEKQMIEWWSEKLSCHPAQFDKTQFDGRSKQTELTGDYYGVCSITLNDTYLYERISGVYLTYIQRQINK